MNGGLLPEPTMDKITLTINGRPVETTSGKTVLQAALDNGIHIPHYCYHPGLSISGNCRMCLVEIEGLPKLQTACSTPVKPGMVVSSTNSRVQSAVRHVLEFLLINHPLDCPVCDQAGECGLQQYYMQVGQYDSRFAENKVTKPKKATPVGRRVMLDQERCILCSRCVRFCREVAGTGEMAIFNRGDQAVIDTFDGRQLESRYSGNLVDICPVGALTCQDFRFQCRVWYLQTAPSICPGCARGCNISIHHNPDRPHHGGGRRVFRFKPRFNPEVNGHWICDDGRYGYRFIDDARIRYCSARQDGSVRQLYLREALDQLADLLRQHPPSRIRYLLSAHSTNEELFATRRLFHDRLGIPCLLPAAGIISGDCDNRLILEDKTPNRRGVREIFRLPDGDGLSREDLAGELDTQGVRLLLVNRHELPAAVLQEIGRAGITLVYLGSNENATAEAATLTIAISTFAEKEGSFTNFQGRVQKLSMAIPPAGESDNEWIIFEQLGVRLGIDLAFGSLPALYRRLQEEVPFFRHCDRKDLGSTGMAGSYE